MILDFVIVQAVIIKESFIILDPIVPLHDSSVSQFAFRMESPGKLTTAQLPLASMAVSRRHLLPVLHNNHSSVSMDGCLSHSLTIKDAASIMNANVRAFIDKLL